MEHITVLLQEAIDALQIQPASVVVDATLGAGGHARRASTLLGPAGTFVGFDADATALQDVQPTLDTNATVHLVHRNFAKLDEVLDELGIGEVDAILADLGWRTDQFISAGRGFSFNDESGLSMTYGDPRDYAFTAADIVNDWAEEDIANVIYAYGEERQSRRIARAIVEARAKTRITTGKQLSDIITAAIGKHGKTNPATKAFQGLRIAVNDEFEVLEAFIAAAFARLKPGGRLAIISFHSLEDRIVKLAFRAYTHDQRGVLVSKKPIVASEAELRANPRARSAKLRVIEKV